MILQNAHRSIYQNRFGAGEQGVKPVMSLGFKPNAKNTPNELHTLVLSISRY